MTVSPTARRAGRSRTRDCLRTAGEGSVLATGAVKTHSVLPAWLASLEAVKTHTKQCSVLPAWLAGMAHLAAMPSGTDPSRKSEPTVTYKISPTNPSLPPTQRHVATNQRQLTVPAVLVPGSTKSFTSDHATEKTHHSL